jgi:hypothetical protein
MVSLTFSGQADGGHPKNFGPMPPDPLFTNRVPCPHTAASLALRQMIDPTGLFMWELMKETEALNAAQLRTLTHELLRPRRYYRDVSPADVIVMEAWADRDLAAATADVLNIADWEDREDSIGEYDSDVEFFGCHLWSQLAERDFPKAVKAADRLKGYETRRQFFSKVLGEMLLKPSQVAAFVQLGQRHKPYASPEDMAQEAVESIALHRGLKEARLALKSLPKSKPRDAAEQRLKRISEDGRVGSLVPPRFESGNGELQKLASLDCVSPTGMCIPYPLLREVLKLSPEEARFLAGNLTEANRKASCWLSWMLFMRAAEGDAAAAMTIAPGGAPALHWADNAPSRAVVAALTAGREGAESSLRAQAAGDDRDTALAGFLARAPIENLERYQKLARDLDAPAEAWQPLLVRMVLAGKAREALAIAETIANPPLPNGEKKVPLSSVVMKAWGLHDFAAAREYVSKLQNAGAGYQYFDRIAEAAAILPPAVALDTQNPMPDALRERLSEKYWLYLAYEAREEGFRFFEGLKDEARSKFQVSDFAWAAARYEPERALALARRWGLEEVNEESFFGMLAAHWPDRVVALAKGITREGVWRKIGWALGKCYPLRAADLLKRVKHSAAWEGAGTSMLKKHPSLLPRLFPHMRKEAAERLRIENAIE